MMRHDPIIYRAEEGDVPCHLCGFPRVGDLRADIMLLGLRVASLCETCVSTLGTAFEDHYRAFDDAALRDVAREARLLR